MGYAKRNKGHAQEGMLKRQRERESWTCEGPNIQKR
jgi:hypothetical protein